MKVLITGKKGKLLKIIASALARQAGAAVVLPVGSRLLDAASDASLQAVLFAVSTDDEVEPIRWMLQQNPSLPVVAVVPRKDPRLRRHLLAEGVSDVVETAGLDASEIRRSLSASLKTFRHRNPREGKQISNDLHAIRSALTAILGSAEMAQKNSSRTSTQKHLQQIFRGVVEIEGVLRRLERSLRPTLSFPRRKAR